MNSYHCLISHSSSNLRLFHTNIFQMHYEYIIYPVTGCHAINTSQRLFLVIPRSLAVSVENETWGEIDWNALICIASQCLSPHYVFSIFLTKLRWLKDKKLTFYWLEANYLYARAIVQREPSVQSRRRIMRKSSFQSFNLVCFNHFARIIIISSLCKLSDLLAKSKIRMLT